MNQRTHTQSKRLFAKAQHCIAGGVNSPSRSFAAVGGGSPVFMERGEGAYLYDADGNRYVDYLCAFGASSWACSPSSGGRLVGPLSGLALRPTEVEFAAKLCACAYPGNGSVQCLRY